jgi:hypothetical protein
MINDKLKVESRVRRLIHYIEDIEKGILQIPAFQRDFVWDKKNKIDLFDSLSEGYPIGSILLWKPDESYGEGLMIGPYTIPQKEDNYFYILDGFQRLSTLFGCLINPDKTSLQINRSLWEKEFQICYDLKKEEFFLPRSKNLEPYQIPVYKLMDTRASYTFQRNLQDMYYSDDDINLYLDRYEKLGSTLIDFTLPSIDITGGTIEKAVDIFSRLNSKGSIISPDWIVSARTYNRQDDFRLGTLIDELLVDLKKYNFEGIKRELVLQCIQSSFGKLYLDVSIEEVLQEINFKQQSRKTLLSIRKAVNFLFEELSVVYSKLLPASIQLVFLTEFFNIVSEPTRKQLDDMKKWFWITTYSNYFTIYSPSKRKEAFTHFQLYCNREYLDPVYYDRPGGRFSAPDLPEKITYGGVRANAYVLFLLNYANDFQPIDSEEVEGIRIFNLFGFKSRPENIVPLLVYVDPFDKNNKIPKFKTSSLEYWLGRGDSYPSFFIGPQAEDFDILSDKEVDKLLDNRAVAISLAEQAFVESLEINYNDEWSYNF